MSKVATSSNSSNARRVHTNKVATVDKDNVRRADANVVTTASKPTKKRADAKIVAKANETATANINKSTTMPGKRMQT